jgi:hypothetical protein
MGEDEHRRVVGRLIAPPPPPVTIPAAANGSEHVASHHVRAATLQQIVAQCGVGLVDPVAEVPLVEREAAAAERVLTVLAWTGDEAVEGDRHMAGC